MATRLGHQSRESVFEQHGRWLERQTPEHRARFCPEGICYVGFGAIFECNHEARLDADFPTTKKEQ